MTASKKGKRREGKPGQVNFRTFPELTDDFDAAVRKLDGWNIRGIDGRGQSKAAVVESLLCHFVEVVGRGEGPTRELENSLKASQRAWVDRLGERPDASSSVLPGIDDPQPIAVPDGPPVSGDQPHRAHKVATGLNRPKRRA